MVRAPAAACCAAVLLLTGHPGGGIASGADTEVVGSHVRGMSEASRQLIDRAIAASPTLAGLAAALDGSDVIVLVEVTLRPDGIAAGIRFLATTGEARVLLIRLDRLRSSLEQIEWLGHEMQHAVEVAGSAARTPAGFESLFRRIGRRAGTANRFETDAAVGRAGKSGRS